MIEVRDIRIYDTAPSTAKRWFIELRLIDLSKGTYVADNGWLLPSYDKSAAFNYNYLGSGLRRVEKFLTEMFSKS